MEECKRLTGDCIVVCSCAPCLVFKIAAFVLVGLPSKLAKKTRRFLSRKLRWRSKKRRKMTIATTKIDVVGAFDAFDLADGSCDWQCPIEAAEEVLLELYDRGGIGFGIFGRSFHQRSDLEEIISSGSGSCLWEMYIFGDGSS